MTIFLCYHSVNCIGYVCLCVCLCLYRLCIYLGLLFVVVLFFDVYKATIDEYSNVYSRSCVLYHVSSFLNDTLAYTVCLLITSFLKIHGGMYEFALYFHAYICVIVCLRVCVCVCVCVFST